MSICRPFIQISLFALCLNLACTSLALWPAPADGYPDEWWKPVPADQVSGWEIPPQAADRSKGEVILSKRNELGLLSNFSASAFVFEGRHYGSIEGLWQALKYPEGPQDERLSNPQVTYPFTREQVEAMTAFEAKNAGKIANENMKKLGINWATYKGEKLYLYSTDSQKFYELIFRATVQKVMQNSDVKTVLLKTGTLNLLPDHHEDPNSGPAYKYFTIAMKIRKALQDGTEPHP